MWPFLSLNRLKMWSSLPHVRPRHIQQEQLPPADLLPIQRMLDFRRAVNTEVPQGQTVSTNPRLVAPPSLSQGTSLRLAASLLCISTVVLLLFTCFARIQSRFAAKKGGRRLASGDLCGAPGEPSGDRHPLDAKMFEELTDEEKETLKTNIRKSVKRHRAHMQFFSDGDVWEIRASGFAELWTRKTPEGFLVQRKYDYSTDMATESVFDFKTSPRITPLGRMGGVESWMLDPNEFADVADSPSDSESEGESSEKATKLPKTSEEESKSMEGARTVDTDISSTEGTSSVQETGAEQPSPSAPPEGASHSGDARRS